MIHSSCVNAFTTSVPGPDAAAAIDIAASFSEFAHMFASTLLLACSNFALRLVLRSTNVQIPGSLSTFSYTASLI